MWLVTTAAAQQQTLWSVDTNLGAATSVLSEPSVAGVESIAVATTLDSKPIWVRAGFDDKTVRLSYLSSAGDVGVFNTFTAPAKVDAMSFADYTNHAHLGWRTVDGICFSSDVTFNAMPAAPDRTTVTEDCKEMRVTSGPPPHG